MEIVTVALDTGGAEAARPSIEAARPEHPSLIDAAHVVDEKFGVVNIPNAVWINEVGFIVRPAEPAYAKAVWREQMQQSRQEHQNPALSEALRIRVEPERYVAALRDWAENGAESPYALAPGEVVARSGTRGMAEAEAAAHFELGQHLHRAGHPSDAVPHFRAAHRLHPGNWTYKRQAWTLARSISPAPQYDSDWLTDVRKVGAENYYPPLEL